MNNYIYLAGACLLWSAMPVVTKSIIESGFISPEDLATASLSTGFVFVIILSVLRKKTGELKKLDKRSIFWLVTGGLGLGSNFILYNYGIDKTTAGATALLENANTILVMFLLGLFFMKEEMNKRKSLGLVLCLAGLFFVTFNGGNIREMVRSEYFRGNMLIILSGIVWGFYGIAQKKLAGRISVLTALSVILFIASMITWIYNGFVLRIENSGYRFMAALLFYGAVFTAMPHLFLAQGLKKINISTAGISFSLIPLLTMAIAFFTLGETIGLAFGVGAALIVSGIVLDSIA